VHFLSFPEVKEEYFDSEIERQVKRMQTVIELTRNIREKNNCSLKVRLDASHSFLRAHVFLFQTPLKELLVFHSDEQYLSDVKSLQQYLQSELNVRDIVFTSDEAVSGLRYRAVADWPVLGKKLRKDLGRVKAALPNVSSDDIKAYNTSGTLTVAGIELVTGDLTVQRYIELPGDSEQYGTHTDNDVVVRLDVKVHPELMGEWLAREFINRVQKLRKVAGLQATDDVHVLYRFPNDTGTELIAAIVENSDAIRRAVGTLPADAKESYERQRLIIEKVQEIADFKFTLSLVHA
jgi:isoleucyl-tRNA synthetase